MRPLPPRSDRLRGTALVLASIACATAIGCGSREEPARADSAPASPDLFLIVIDTARVDRFGCYGYSRPTTPHIDAFARDAVLYRGVRSPAPWTLPSHASMFTGLRAGEHGLHFAPPAPGRASLSPVSGLRAAARDRLLARLLRDRGYGTIGISSNRWISPATELDAGFDHFYLLPPRRLKRERAVAEWLGAPPRTSTAAEQSLELLAKHLDDDSLHRPIFAFLNLIEPHFPYLPERGFAGRFGGDRSTLRALLREHDSLERAMLGGSVQPDPQLLSDLYDEELAQVDAGVGEIFDALRARGLYDDALIVVTSDHGEHLGEDGHYSHQLTMRPELLDVPLIVKYPHNAGAGSTVDLPLASTADVHQTLLAAAWPENPLAGGWSQNLARPEAFDRAWNVAEYYYSLVYLALLEKAAPKFERGVHERIRRVIFTSRGAHPIDSAEAGEAMPGLPSGVSAQVRSYIESLEKGGESPTVTLDAEDLEALRALGYVE